MKTTSINQIKNNPSSKINPDSIKTIFQALITVLIIVAISTLVNVSIHLDYVYLNSSVGEISITENLQLVMLAISSWCFLSIYLKNEHVSHAAILISGFFFVMIIREMDFLFDMIHHGFWVLPALSVAILSCFKACKGGKNTVNEMACILQIPHMKLLMVAVVLLLVYSRLYGMGSFWHSVMGAHYVRDVKNISEESMELLCYCLIAMSSVRVRHTLKSKGY
ncbi:hypothetical protein [Vibrio caribbeanicus]|uniref:hypothetical protein n=1 Tax=Vibrio caribbeanicus TaxID=701175 RepID=UPI0030DA9FD6